VKNLILIPLITFISCTTIKDGDVITKASVATSFFPCGDYIFIYTTQDDDKFCSDKRLKVGDTIQIKPTTKEEGQGE